MNGNVPVGESTFDWTWDKPRYLPITSAAADDSDRTLQPARPVDLQEFYVVVNGVTMPARRLVQSTSINTARSDKVRLNGSNDYSEAYEYYRKVCAVPHDCPLSTYDWQSIKVYVVDMQLTDSMGVADPTAGNAAIDIFVTTTAAAPQGSNSSRVVAVMAQYVNQLTCDASRNYSGALV